MYNFENLNDYEFELLCKDIMEKKLNEKLYSFSRGPDGGIDICDAKENPNIVIQVKHYYKSSVSTLISALNKELPKAEKLNPKKYYICTSYKLTKKNKDEIFQLFRKYMVDLSNIIDGIEINDFLEDATNIDIVRKHYKLWLCASNVLDLLNNRNVFIDCEELIDEINRDLPLFVQTTAYFEAIKALEESNMIILLGSPGVGKSTLSKMLLLHYVKDGYIVRYTTDNEISTIKKVLSNDRDKKEIVLLDDFLGQRYLNIKDSRPNEIKTLISYIKRNPNKKIILNSRITILNEAKKKSSEFGKLMKDNKNSQYTINLDEMSPFEKAKILYNHLYFTSQKIGIEYFSSIKKDENYYKIIKHKNYNPRIIEYVTNYGDFEQITPENYFDYIMNKLNNPKDIWEDEFRNRLSESDRILIHTLYSLTDTKIDIEILEKVFNKRIRFNGNMDTTINIFEGVIKRLGESLIKKICDHDQNRYISVINPSINDYLKKEIQANENEQLNVLKSAVYIEQLLKVTQSEESKQFLISEIISEKIFQLECLRNSLYFYYIQMVIDMSIYDVKIKKSVYNACEHLYENAGNNSYYANLLYQIMDKKFIEFYGLDDIFLDREKIYLLLDKVYNSKIDLISNKYIDSFGSKYKNNKKYHEALKVFRKLIIEKISQNVYELVEDDLYTIAFDEFDSYVDEYGQLCQGCLLNSLQCSAKEATKNYIKETIKQYSKEFDLHYGLFNIEEIIEDLDFQETIDAVLKEEYDDLDNNHHQQWLKTHYSFEEIKAMFEH